MYVLISFVVSVIFAFVFPIFIGVIFPFSSILAISVFNISYFISPIVNTDV